jgi:phosphonatase-like hydrolase
MIRLVVLDMAGTTILDPDGVGGALKAALTAAGVPWTPEQVNGIMGIPKPVAIRQIMGGDPDAETIDTIHRNFQRRMVAYYESDPAVGEIPGALDTFRLLRARGLKIVLDTGFDRTIVDTILRRLNWEHELDATVASNEVERGRPFPDLIHRAMELTGVSSPKEVAKVGDTPSDMQEGTAAECAMVIGVTYGTHTEAELRAQPHTHLMHDIAELPDLLTGLVV